MSPPRPARWAAPALVAAVLAAVVAPAVLAPPALADAGVAVLLATAAAGLAVTVRGAGIPSLAHGAFVGLGVYTAAVLRQRYGADPLAAVALAGVAGAVAGRLTAAAVAGRRPAFAALVTWLLGWAFAGAVGNLPWLTGGTRGIVLPPARTDLAAVGVSFTIGPAGWWWASVALAGLGLGALTALRRRYGPVMSLVRADPEAALAQGVPVGRVRTAALTVPAVLATLTGAVLVHVVGVADPGRAGMLLSAQLFVVVLLGGTTGPLGPIVGLAVLGAVEAGVGRLFAAVTAADSTLAGTAPAVAAVAVVALLALVPDGLVPRAGRWWRRRGRGTPGAEPSPEGGAAAPAPAGAPAPAAGSVPGTPALAARDLTLALGGNPILDSVDIEFVAGMCVGILGPNGSGKTMLLRVLTGAVEPDRGTVRLGGRPLSWGPRREGPPRRRTLGLARSPQRLLDAPGLTPRAVVAAAMEPHRPRSALPALLCTPRSRAETAAADAAVEAVLSRAGVAGVADRPLQSLDLTARRLTQFAAACVGRPRVVLLDEPAAGLDDAGTAAVVRAIRTLVAGGIAVGVVEHDRRVLRGAADRVVALVGGRVVATGTLEGVLANPEVRAGWLGTQHYAPAR